MDDNKHHFHFPARANHPRLAGMKGRCHASMHTAAENWLQVQALTEKVS